MSPGSRPRFARPRAAPSGLRPALFASLLLLAAGCGSEPARRGLPGEVIQLRIRDERLDVEVACDEHSRRRGLMDRERLPESAGMLFIFPEPKLLSFWMKDTLLPLSIAFIDGDGRIVQIEDMKPHDETHTESKTRVQYALETNRGWFERHGVAAGEVFAGFSEAVAPYLRAAR